MHAYTKAAGLGEGGKTRGESRVRWYSPVILTLRQGDQKLKVSLGYIHSDTLNKQTKQGKGKQCEFGGYSTEIRSIHVKRFRDLLDVLRDAWKVGSCINLEFGKQFN
jgi:hypothetical protein